MTVAEVVAEESTPTGCAHCGDRGFVLTLLFTINQSYQLVVLLQLLVDVSLLHA